MRLRCALFEACSGKIVSSSDFDAVVGENQLALPVFLYSELANATNSFSKCLGRGAYAAVYYGILKDGRKIAVYRFHENEQQRVQRFMNETVILNLLPHRNLVSIYGCAFRRRKESLLVNEYISSGTLADHLHGKTAERGLLAWSTRLDIAIDIADALTYLHNNRIIHCDVKSTNILLDENCCAKLKNLHLSLQLPRGVSVNDTHVTTDLVGTYGYIDPEYASYGEVSVKSDVYSFGVVLCELISSKPAIVRESGEDAGSDIASTSKRSEKAISLAAFAIRKMENQALDELLDSTLGFESDDEMITAVAELAYQCLRCPQKLRPSMAQVLETLKNIREGRIKSNLVTGECQQQQNDALKHAILEKTSLENDSGINFQFKVFTRKKLEEATNNFKNCLGRGGFGTVYYGKLQNGLEVAIKRFHEKTDKTVQQYMREIEILSLLRHQNLVSIYGCSPQYSNELLLVYEYVCNGTLASHLHGNSATKLAWLTRFDIAVETATALAYLHSSGIIHRDVKANNILLNENFSVKVADFGLSRHLPLNGSQGNAAYVSHVSTAPVGTPAYIDPEYYESNRVSDKSDVYSFGVVLFELISSKPPTFKQGPQHFTLANFAMTKMLNNDLENLVDRCLGFDTDKKIREIITTVAELAFQCVQCPKELRPSMKQVLGTLEGIKQGTWGFNQIT